MLLDFVPCEQPSKLVSSVCDITSVIATNNCSAS